LSLRGAAFGKKVGFAHKLPRGVLFASSDILLWRRHLSKPNELA
jgi:hypothetical protein